jgi:cis-L-3-hydroxyproline dehydratase
MEVIVRYANVMNAEELCIITKAYLHYGYHSYLKAVKSENVAQIISEMFFCTTETLPLKEVYHGSMGQCVRVAISGRWEEN